MANGDSFLSTAGSDLSSVGAGLGKILSNPLAQMALGAYFGTISSPRRLGWGTALGQGGLAGLNQFAQAERLQAEQPKLQAETQLDVTKAAQAKQQMGAQQQMLDWLDKDPSAQKMDPQQRMILRLAVTSGRLQPGMLGLTPYQQAQLAQSKQRTSIQQQEAQQRMGLSAQEAQQRIGIAEQELRAREGQIAALEATYPSEIAERQASAARSGAETKVAEARLTGHLPPESAAKPPDPALEASRGQAILKNARANYTAGLGLYARHTYNEGDFHKYLVGRNINPKSGLPLPPLDAGWNYGDPLPDGTPTAVDPNGKVHKWQE